ncbi:hypothetical protein ACP0HG_27185, partial [Escherichia coli]
SGPAILQISSYWRHGDSIAIDFLPERPKGWLREAKRTEPRLNLRSLLNRQLPERLATTLAERIALPSELGNCRDAL